MLPTRLSITWIHSRNMQGFTDAELMRIYEFINHQTVNGFKLTFIVRMRLQYEMSRRAKLSYLVTK